MKAGRPSWVSEDTDELCAAMSHLDNIAETRAFLRDLLTEREINEFANRWKVARMLYANLRWGRIEKISGVSSATIAKVRKQMAKKEGGYDLMFKKITQKARK